MIRRHLAIAAALAALSTVASAADVVVTLPNVLNGAGQARSPGLTFVLNADGTLGSLGGSSGGVAQGQVVTGDQAYAVGSNQPLNLTATGRLKVGVSSAGNIEPAAQLGTTIAADLISCKYRTPVTWSVGWTGSIACDAAGNVLIGVSDGRNVAEGATTDPAYTGTGAGSLVAMAKGNYGVNASQLLGIGAPNDTAYVGSGTTSIIGASKGVYALNAAQLASLGAAGDAAGANTIIGQLKLVNTGPTPAGTNNIGSVTIAGGNVGNGVADTGNPVKIGGKANSSAPTAVTAGQRVDAWYGLGGAAASGIVDLVAGTIAPVVGTGAGPFSPAGRNALSVYAHNAYYEPTSGNWLSAKGDSEGAYIKVAPSALAASGIAPTVTAAVANGIILKASGGNLYGLNVVSGASAGYVMVFNSMTVPPDGAVTPTRCMPIAANSGLELNWRSVPLYLPTGISVAFSTTGCFNKTASATAFISGDAK